MKKGAIVRLIVWSVVAVALVATLIFAMLANGLNETIKSGGDWFIGISGAQYPDSGEYAVYSEPISIIEDINRINIDWISGSIDITVFDGKTIEIEETSIEEESNRMRYRIKNGVLDIQYQKSGFFFGFVKIPKKSLTVKIPADMADSMQLVSIDTTSAKTNLSGIALSESLNITTVSGDVTLDKITAPSLDFDTTSGNITVAASQIDEISGDSVSGDLTAEGTFSEIENDTTSGNVKITSSALPRSIESDSVSGGFTLIVPESDGFTAEFDTVSGKFNCDFETTLDDGKYIHKNGAAEYQFDTISGDVTIKRN